MSPRMLVLVAVAAVGVVLVLLVVTLLGDIDDPAEVRTEEPLDAAEAGPATSSTTTLATTTTVVPTPAATTTTIERARSAPTGDVWDRLAACESGGRWDIANDGYEGGLEFTHRTWLAYRPDGYPDHANEASRDQQIDVGRLVLAGQGPGAWPTCGPIVGLRRGA